MKLVLAAVVLDNGYAEGAAGQVRNFVHYVVVKGIRSGITLAKHVVEQE